MPTPDDPSAIDFVRDNCIQYQAIHYVSVLSTTALHYMPVYGFVQHYRLCIYMIMCSCMDTHILQYICVDEVNMYTCYGGYNIMAMLGMMNAP